MALSDVLFDFGFFRPRNVVPALLAAVVGVIAWFGILPMLGGDGQVEPVEEAATERLAPVAATPVEPVPVEAEPVYPVVLVAKRAIASGVLVVAELVAWTEWREEVDFSVAVVEDAVPLQAILGAVTVRPFAEGELIAWDGLILPGSPGFITAVLEPGRRAVTVEVDRATTDANIIYPGDRVDVILVTDSDSTGGLAARSIVRDVRTLAVGSTIVSLGRYGKASLSSVGVVEAVTPPSGETYTLEVLPRDAERIALAADHGRLTLAIRPIFSAPSSAPTGAPVRFGEVMEPPDPPERRQVRVIRGGLDEKTVTVGGL